MNYIEQLLDMHRQIEMLRRRSIAEYWRENQSDDLVALLNQRQIHQLMTIDHHGPCSLQVIMQHTGLSKSASSAAVDKLVRLGLVNRVQNAANRRQVLISLTPALRQHLDALKIRFVEDLKKSLAACTSEEITQLERAAQIVTANLSESPHDHR